MTINKDDEDDNTLYEHEEREINHSGVFLKQYFNVTHLVYTLTSV